MRVVLAFLVAVSVGFFSFKEVKAQSFGGIAGERAFCGGEPAKLFSKKEEQMSTINKKISAEEANKLMAKMKAESTPYIVLDVRTVQEFNEGRIKDAILIPDFEITKRAEKELTNKDKTIFVYCRSGKRSAKAAAELVKMGYKNVYDFGGILDWKYGTVKN